MKNSNSNIGNSSVRKFRLATSEIAIENGFSDECAFSYKSGVRVLKKMLLAFCRSLKNVAGSKLADEIDDIAYLINEYLEEKLK